MLALVGLTRSGPQQCKWEAINGTVNSGGNQQDNPVNKSRWAEDKLRFLNQSLARKH